MRHPKKLCSDRENAANNGDIMIIRVIKRGLKISYMSFHKKSRISLSRKHRNELGVFKEVYSHYLPYFN